MGLVERLDRRGFLALAAAAVASSARTARAQTLISDTPDAGTGHTRQAELVVSAPSGPPPQPKLMPGAGSSTGDWRRELLAGERSILMRRDGRAERVRYCTAGGELDRDGYAVACHLLRDVRAGRMFTMDPRLLDVLCGIQRWGEFNGRSSVIQVNSGFRTHETNGDTEGAARNSMHLYGRAADIVLDGFSSGLVGAMVRAFNSNGGTGVYLSRGFVHVDTGAARMWVYGGRRP